MFYLYLRITNEYDKFETSLATLPMETNIAFCAHTSCIFFCTLYIDPGLLQIQGSDLLHRSAHPEVVQQQHYFQFHSVVEL